MFDAIEEEDEEFLKRQQELYNTLRKFVNSTRGVDLAAVVSIEGLPIALYPEAAPHGMDDTRVAAMTAAMLALGDRAVMELQRGNLVRVMVEGDNGWLISVTAGEMAVVTVATDREIKLGFVMNEIYRLAEKIKALLE